MNPNMYVVNLALKREDGKIEQDTLFLENPPTLQLAEEIANKLSCDVVLSGVGRCKPYAYESQKKYTFLAKAPEKKEAETLKPEDLENAIPVSELRIQEE